MIMHSLNFFAKVLHPYSELKMNIKIKGKTRLHLFLGTSIIFILHSKVLALFMKWLGIFLFARFVSIELI
jgi:hypothetical protein